MEEEGLTLVPVELSPREREVIKLLADGLINKEIAQELRLSTYTVNDHLKSIYGKLGVSNRAGATAVWLSLDSSLKPTLTDLSRGTVESHGVRQATRYRVLTLFGVAIAIFAVGAVLFMESLNLGGESSNQAGDPLGVKVYLAGTRIPAEQHAALADGYVTHAEHEAAIQKAIGCASAAGVTMRPVPGEGLRPTRLGFVASDDAELRASETKLGECVATYLSVVESVQAAQPIDEDTMVRSSAILAECMNSELGRSEFRDATIRTEIDDMLAAKQRNEGDWRTLRAWDDCRFIAEAETGFHS